MPAKLAPISWSNSATYSARRQRFPPRAGGDCFWPSIFKISPIDGRRIASVRAASDEEYQKAITRAQEAFLKWRITPGPVRGDTVRRLGNALRELKQELGQLVTLETGKIIAEGEGEVQ